jgi:MoxR-like ATPase
MDAVVPMRDIAAARSLVDRVHIDDRVKDYIVDLVYATREPDAYRIDLAPPPTRAPAPRGRAQAAQPQEAGSLISFGASPRATICLALAAKANAFLEGRAYVTPHDVKTIALDVLRHRVIASYEAEAQEITSETIVRRILDALPVP